MGAASAKKLMPAWVLGDLIDRSERLEMVIIRAAQQLPPEGSALVLQLFEQEVGESATQLFKRRGLDDNADL